MESLHGNMHVFVLSCFKIFMIAQKMHVFMFFVPFSASFYPSPQYIIMVKGLLNNSSRKEKAPLKSYFLQ